jgi:hypothetical protein
MTLSTLRASVREKLDDASTPYKRSDERLNQALNNAVAEYCLRTRRLQDDSSTACRGYLAADQADYALNPAVLVVRAVHVDGRTRPLTRTTAERMDLERPGWRHGGRTGLPEYAVFDVAQKKLSLWPTPSSTEEDAEARYLLRVWRLPLAHEVMAADTMEPILAPVNPDDLTLWACAELLRGKDAELHDNAKAQEYEDQFTAKVGTRPSEHELRLWSTSPPTGIRMSSEF